MSKCPRLTCEAPASHRVRIHFLSDRVLQEDLCADHAHRLFDGLMRVPQSASGSCTPIAVGQRTAA